MKKATPEENTDQSTRPTHDRTELEDMAFDRIYKRYGSDLGAFFRDAYREIESRRQSLNKCEENAEGRRS